MNQVPTPAQNAACLEHLAVLDQNDHSFARQVFDNNVLEDHGFSVTSGLVSSPEAGVAVRIRGKLPTTLARFLRDMSDDGFLPLIDSSILLNKTLVRYHVPEEASRFGDVVLRHMRVKQTSALAPRGCERISIYAMQSEKDAQNQPQRVIVRSHSLTPKDTIQLFLRPTDRMLHDSVQFDQLREIYSTVTLGKSPHQVGEVLIDQLSVYQLPGVPPLVYEAVMARTMLNKYCILFDHYLGAQNNTPAAAAVAAATVAPHSTASSFFGPNVFPVATSTSSAALEHVQTLKSHLRGVPTVAKASWW